MSATLSLGGATIGAAVVYANLRPWWRSKKRDPKDLLPFGAGAALGALSTICVGGALGWGANGLAGLASHAGDRGVASVSGTPSPPLATARMGVLTAGGGTVVVLLLVGVVLMYRSAEKKDRRRIVGGFATGAILGILPGVAATLQWLPHVANWAGAAGVRALSSGKSLL